MGNTLQANQAYTQHGDSNSHEEVIADISPECLTELTSLKISKEKANIIDMMIRGQSDNDQRRMTTKHSTKTEMILHNNILWKLKQHDMEKECKGLQVTSVCCITKKNGILALKYVSLVWLFVQIILGLLQAQMIVYMTPTQLPILNPFCQN